MPPSYKTRRLLFLCLIGAIVISVVLAVTHQSKVWIVPEEAKQRANPLTPTESNLKSGRELYHDDCANCHGNAGKGDGSEAHLHDPKPTDLTDATRMAKITDGELFFKISEGRRPMPSFKRRLTEDQRWQIVLVLRTFSTPSR